MARAVDTYFARAPNYLQGGGGVLWWAGSEAQDSGAADHCPHCPQTGSASAPEALDATLGDLENRALRSSGRPGPDPTGWVTGPALSSWLSEGWNGVMLASFLSLISFDL